MITHLTSSRRSGANIVAAKSFMTLKALPKYADSYMTSVSKSARPIIAKQFTKLNSGLIYLFGAVVKNSTKNLSWDIVSVYAMVNTARHQNTTMFQCCIVYTYNHNVTQIYKVTPIYVRPHWANAKIMAYHFTCPNVLHWLMEFPAFIGITATGLECGPTSEEYVEPNRSLQQPKSTLAISTQVAYGSVNAELIIEWIEAYRYLGVDKIVSYFIQNINKEALDVLLYYHNLKVIDLFYYVPAAEGRCSF